MRRATKTETIRALRSVNDALRSTVGLVSASDRGYTVTNGDGHARFVRETLTTAERIERVDTAIRRLQIAEARIEIARDHLFSYRARLDEKMRHAGELASGRDPRD